MAENEKIEKKEHHRPTLADWVYASRPQYFVATIVPITLGFVLAGTNTGEWRYVIYLLVLIASFLMHLATNLANDLFDWNSGVDNINSIGGSLALREGRISKRDYKIALCLLYGSVIVISPFIIVPSGQPVLWLFMAFGIFSSIYYTAPPFRFGYRALGEALVFVNMGLVMVCGSYIACAHGFELSVLAYGIVIGSMVALILYFQCLPEIETDAASGKFTLAVRLGMEKAFFLYKLWWPVTWISITIIWLCGKSSWTSFGWILAIPFYVQALVALKSTTKGTLLELDNKGYLTRIMYLITGIALIVGAGLNA